MTLRIVHPSKGPSQTNFRKSLVEALADLDQTHWSNEKIIEWLMAQAVLTALSETQGDKAVDRLSEALGRALPARSEPFRKDGV